MELGERERSTTPRDSRGSVATGPECTGPSKRPNAGTSSVTILAWLPGGKRPASIRFDYINVRAPAGVP